MKYVPYIIIAMLLISLYYFYRVSKLQPYPETLIVHDTTTITRYEQAVKKDTVIKWYEKVVTHQSKPEIIYQQKIDTVFRDKIKNYDLILGLDKQGTKLRVFAVNEAGMLLKEQLFENVYSNFTAYSAENAVIVKSQLWYWNGLKLGYTQLRPVNSIKDFTHSIDLLTGINFIEKYSLDAGLEYDLTNKNVNLKAKVTVRLF